MVTTVTPISKKSVAAERPSFAQKHYTVPELAKMWHMSAPMVRAAARREPDVIRFGSPTLRPGKKRKHENLRISEAVAQRIYNRLIGAA